MVVAASVAVPFDAMASACEVRLAGVDPARAEQLAQAAIDEVRRIETSYSRYRADSVISRINRAAGAGWVEVDAETDALLDYAASVHAASGGLFDITSGVLRRVWDFRQARLPDPEQLKAVLALIGWDKVERAPGRVRLALAGMELDFGGFGKEYAADRAAAVLAARGVRSGYVNLGGDLRVIGPQADGSAWQIGIQDPRQPDAVIATIGVGWPPAATMNGFLNAMGGVTATSSIRAAGCRLRTGVR